MNIKQLACAAIIGALSIVPVQAQECVSKIPDFVGQIEKNDGKFLGLLDLETDVYDQIMVIELKGIVFAALFSEGCIISALIPIVKAPKRVGA